MVFGERRERVVTPATEASCTTMQNPRAWTGRPGSAWAHLFLYSLPFIYLPVVLCDAVAFVGLEPESASPAWLQPMSAIDIVSNLCLFVDLLVCIRFVIKHALWRNSIISFFLLRGCFCVFNIILALQVLSALPHSNPAVLRLFRLTKLIGVYNELSIRLLQKDIHPHNFSRQILQGGAAPLRYGDSLQRLTLPQTTGYHVFLSHLWANGQDAAGTIVSRLLALDVGCRCFLDVNDLRNIQELELMVESSTVFAIFLTHGYISSVNCRRELTAAYVANKRIVVILESEPQKGAVTLPSLQSELLICEQAQRLGKEERKAVSALLNMIENQELLTLPIPRVVHWYREMDLKRVVYKTIIASVLAPSIREASPTRKRSILEISSKKHSIFGGAVLIHLDNLKFTDEIHFTQQAYGGRSIYLSRHYQEIAWSFDSSKSVFDLLHDDFARCGVQVVTRKDATIGAIVFFCPEAFERAELVREMISMAAACNAGTRKSLRQKLKSSNMAGTIEFAQKIGHLSRASRATSITLTEGSSLIVGLYSTEKLFSYYLDVAPVALKASGLLNVMFEKYAVHPAMRYSTVAKISRQLCFPKRMIDLSEVQV